MATKKYTDLSNGDLFEKSLVSIFRRISALSIDFKMKAIRKNFFFF